MYKLYTENYAIDIVYSVILYVDQKKRTIEKIVTDS